MPLLNPYLSFHGSARGAMEFYKSVFGGELTISTFGEYQMPGVADDEVDNVMHAQLTTPSGFTLMGSDVPAAVPLAEGSSVTISLSGPETDELRGYWDKLSEGGETTLPLAQAPWGDWFGQLTDQFGIAWMIDITGQVPADEPSSDQG